MEGEFRRIKEGRFTRRMDKEGRIIHLQKERKKERKESYTETQSVEWQSERK